MAMIERGLDDGSLKVRMEACQALGRRPGDDAARMLVATIGTDTDLDVKHAAMEALARHDSPISRDALKLALADRNPATRSLAMESLRDVTGENYGDDPQVWIAALNGEPTPQPQAELLVCLEVHLGHEFTSPRCAVGYGESEPTTKE